MVRHIAFLCAAVAGFGLSLERPNNLAEARRRCCCYEYRNSGNYCQNGYQTYAYQNQYQNQYVNQCGQTNGQGTQYQSYSQGGEVNVPAPAPAAAPAPDNRSTYYRNGNAPQDIRRNGAATPPAAPAPATSNATPPAAQPRTFDAESGTNRTNNPERNAPATERPAPPAPTVPE